MNVYKFYLGPEILKDRQQKERRALFLGVPLFIVGNTMLDLFQGHRYSFVDDLIYPIVIAALIWGLQIGSSESKFQKLQYSRLSFTSENVSFSNAFGKTCTYPKGVISKVIRIGKQQYVFATRAGVRDFNFVTHPAEDATFLQDLERLNLSVSDHVYISRLPLLAVFISAICSLYFLFASHPNRLWLILSAIYVLVLLGLVLREYVRMIDINKDRLGALFVGLGMLFVVGRVAYVLLR